MIDRRIDDLLPYLLARASVLISGRFYALLKRQGMPVNEWRALAVLSDGGGVMLGDLADMILAEQSTTTRLVARLQARGLVEKRADPGDRRRTLLFITATGRRAVAGLMEQALEIDAEILGAIDEARGARLKEDLAALIDAFAGNAAPTDAREPVRIGASG